MRRCGALAATALIAAAPLLAQGAVAGTITDVESLAPVAGAQVFLEATVIGTVSGADGTYRLEGVPAGEQTITVQPIGYRRASRTVTVSSGRVSTADFTVERAPAVPDSVIVITGGGKRGPPVGPQPHQFTIGPPVGEYPDALAELRQENGPRTRAELDSVADMLVMWATSEEVIYREGIGRNLHNGREGGMGTAVMRSAITLRAARDVYDGAFDAVVRIFEATESPEGAEWAFMELRIIDEARAVEFAVEVAARTNAKSCAAQHLLRYGFRGEHPIYSKLEQDGAFGYACPRLDDPG